MCIIAVKNKGVKLMSDDTIKTMFNNNSDGAGFMYAHNGRVIVNKGYMTVKALIKAIRKLEKTVDITDTPMVLHFRITTHGASNRANTHPFVISDDFKQMGKTYATGSLAMAHNGVIHCDIINTKYSDTMHFIKTSVMDLQRLNSEFYKNESGKRLLYELAQSKLAFMDATGFISMIGDFIAHDGIYYSNSSYKAYTPTTLSTNYNKSYMNEYDYYNAGDYIDILELYTLSAHNNIDGYIQYDNGDIDSLDGYLIDDRDNVYIYDYYNDLAVLVLATARGIDTKPLTPESYYIDIENIIDSTEQLKSGYKGGYAY